MAKVAVLGYGTVGSGVVKVLSENAGIVEKNAGEKIEVTRVLDLRDFPGDPVQDILVKDFDIIEKDPDIDIVVETMGGTKPAYDFVKRSLLAGKSVCTSNKALVADHGTELIRIAREKEVNFFFEASVGGGIPVLRPLVRCLVADEILQISGILNGTTNFILTKMDEEQVNFDTVLKEAQRLGYAEKDPTADIEGYDACRKIAILTALAYGAQVDFGDIHTEGITKLTTEDFAYAKKLGKTIKLLGSSCKRDGKLYAFVAPLLIGDSNPLFSVNGVFNAICITGNMLDDVMFYGQGAGKEATASAVVTDVVEAAKNKGKNVFIRWDEEKQIVSPMAEMENEFFVRVEKESCDKVKELFGEVEFVDAGIDGEVGFVTSLMREDEFEEKLGKIDGVKSEIRVGK